MTLKSTRMFNFWRFLALSAFFCTCILTLVLFAEALKPGQESSNSSGAVTDSIKDSININDNDQVVPLQSITVAPTSTTKCIGETQKIETVYLPASTTEKELVYSSSAPDIVDVDENGVMHFKSYGRANITVTSKEHPEIKGTLEAICGGLKAEDLSNTYPTFSYSSDEIRLELFEGDSVPLGLRDASNGNQPISPTSVTFVSDNPKVLEVSYYKVIYAHGAGTATITVTVNETNETKDFVITVKEKEGFAPLASVPLIENTVYMNIGEEYAASDFVAYDMIPAGAVFSYNTCKTSLVENADNCLKKISEKFLAVRSGEAVIEYSPYYEPENISLLRVIVIEPVPNSIFVAGNNRIVPDKNYSYNAIYDGAELSKIKWSVVSGNATITEDGVLTAHGLGSVKIRATSTVDGDVFGEMEITISLFERFASFVRKIIGHFLAFAVLGLGLTATFYFLVRPRGFAWLFASASGFAIAGITEIFQLPVFTPNRGPSFKDVLIDTSGAICGVIACVLVLALIRALFKLISKDKYEALVNSLDILSFKTAFLPSAGINSETKEKEESNIH